MVDLQTVCCMCGDVGFPDKLFRCTKCHHRFQHSYCSNYYSESSEPIEHCDWCQSEERSSRSHGSSSKKCAAGNDSGSGGGATNRSEYSGDKIKQHDRDESATTTTAATATATAEKGKNPSGAPSPRTTTRRYKLLKDVMC
ncbi:uncharacterized protein LOC114320536 [Camellia sinensis]|uniref:PHD-type zinc finger plants domain-containing protein n=1 Tax=Camellia sinensis var. sinensis TaxID=542762 RepID=A0A4S4CXC7_CAMSN|nr:uncharacterized protein LOC114320536 [Camellia sinensis]THF94539.1 hypothetical protein TEA_016471 [Camellia sinensis var. sinensis]